MLISKKMTRQNHRPESHLDAINSNNPNRYTQIKFLKRTNPKWLLNKIQLKKPKTMLLLRTNQLPLSMNQVIFLLKFQLVPTKVDLKVAV
jgi:hypothetical protein